MKTAAMLLLVLSIFVLSSLGYSWDGPPASIGASLSNLARPSDYLDLSGSGYWNGTTPFNGRLRMNKVTGDSDVDTVQLNAKLEDTNFQTATALGGAGVNVPTNLLGVDVGAIYNHKIQGKADDWGIIGSLGSDSDVPFNSLQEVDISVTGTYHYTVDQLHSWLFLVNYSPTRAFLPGVPIPGASYIIINPQAHTILSLGLPLFFRWQFKPLWSLSLTYLIPFTTNATVDYRLDKNTKLFANFQWYTQTWLRAFRPDNLNRIIFDQKRVTGGISVGLGDDYFASAFFGFAFDQQLYEAHSQTLSPTNSQFLPFNLVGQVEIARKF